MKRTQHYKMEGNSGGINYTNKLRMSRKMTIAVASSTGVLVGSTAGPLLIRYYFQNGGSKKWLSTLVQTAGFPVTLPLVYYLFKKDPSSENHMNAKMFIWSTVLGVLIGLLNFVYSYGLAYIPVSTSQVLLSTSLGFTAVFAYVLARQKINVSTVNGVVLLTMSSVLLAFNSRSTDRPQGVTISEHIVGFAFILMASLLNGLITPLVQAAYQHSKVVHFTVSMVLEMQAVMSAWATLFSLAGLLASKEFMELKKEAQEFRGHGVSGYVLVNVSCSIFLTVSLVGMCGVTLAVNSVWAGMLLAVTIPLTEVSAVLLFGEKFQAEKGVSTVMALWGIFSYVFGEFRACAKGTVQNAATGQWLDGVELPPAP